MEQVFYVGPSLVLCSLSRSPPAMTLLIVVESGVGESAAMSILVN